MISGVEANLTLELEGHVVHLEGEGQNLALRIADPRALRAIVKHLGARSSGARRLLQVDQVLRDHHLSLTVEIGDKSLIRMGESASFGQRLMAKLLG